MGNWSPDTDSSELLRQWLTDRTDPESPALHSERVAMLAAALACAMGIDDEPWLEALRLGCAVHDIGKLAVPEGILKKPGALTSDEWHTVRQHPEWGAVLVERLGMSREVKAAVRHHHERWDGSGYPDGLAGDAIPLEARVVCVVDVYDALTSDRSYRRALSRDEALAVMDHEAGRTIDPNIYDVFRNRVALEAGRGVAA
jgi:putative nucleotidyltransferase with HDIG domain